MGVRSQAVQGQVRRAARRGWLEPAARAGLAAKAALYGIIGALALAVAVGGGGQTADQSGALAALADEPLDGVLVRLLAAGLLGYGL